MNAAERQMLEELVRRVEGAAPDREKQVAEAARTIRSILHEAHRDIAALVRRRVDLDHGELADMLEEMGREYQR